MTREEFLAIRKHLGLTQTDLARFLRMTPRCIRQYELGERAVSGPVSRLMELVRDGVIPG